ncbi:hypothetical protein MZM54_01315 [[Brevibacterium] frigoritolerans]|nr:hypothetical protein [Peribacillus frigoritolerans]
MNDNYYGIIGSASYEPKQFVLKAIKKIQLNNKNAIKFFKMNESGKAQERLINTVHLLEEMDLTLNRENENPIVDRVSMHYQWLMDVFEKIMAQLDEEDFSKEKLEKEIESTELTLQNLYDGFAGMTDQE